MFDIWLGDINFTVLIIIFSICVVFPIQLLICFKTKSLLSRIMLPIIFVIAAIIFYIIGATGTEWGYLIYVFFSIYAVGMAVICGLALAIWAIIRKTKK